MKIGDLVEYIGDYRSPLGKVGVVIDYNYYPEQHDEALVLWSCGSSAWYFERRLTIINNGGSHEQSD